MHHYIALRWNQRDARAVSEASRLSAKLGRFSTLWSAQAQIPGIAVYCRGPSDSGMRNYRLPGGFGMIMGRLFRASDRHAPVDLSHASARLMSETAGRYLVTNYWGNYVAILQDPRTDSTYVIRDCTGHIPCYYTHHHGVHVFFASLRDIECLDLGFTVNESYLCQSILRHPLHLRTTALTEVRQALAGDCIAISATGTDQYPIWQPETVATLDVIDDYSAALSTLRNTTETVLALWSSVYDRILLHLSGGLDSAIVLGCLKKLGLAHNVICVNHFTRGTADDERQYARVAAGLAGATLAEVPRESDGAAFVKSLTRLPFEPAPSIAHLGRLLLIGQINRLAEQNTCASVWTGQGGDHIFLQAPHPHGAADYLLHHRLPWQAPKAVYDSALLDRDSVWSVLWKAMGHRLRFRSDLNPSADIQPDGTGFLTPSALARSTTIDDMTSSSTTTRLPPGKLLQISDFRDLLNRHIPLVGLEHPFEQHPLISQPLIELSLRIPTYLLQRNGIHRAMAREAFADRVPTCILEREDKGDITDSNRLLLRNSAPLLCDLLLDGELVSRGLVQRRALQNVLLGQATYRAADIFPIFACIAAETWIRNWSCSRFRAPGSSLSCGLEGIC